MEYTTMTDFVTLPVWFPDKNKEQNGYFKSEIRINPFYLMYYYPMNIEIDENETEITVINISSSHFYVALTYLEFDEIWAEVKRGFKSENFKI